MIDMTKRQQYGFHDDCTFEVSLDVSNKNINFVFYMTVELLFQQ